MALRVCLAGHVRLESDLGGSDAVGLGRLGRLALAYLVVNRDRPVPKSELANVLWGDELPRSFDQLVRGLASKIRVVLQDVGLDPETLTTRVGTYELQLPADAVVDVEEATGRVSAARAALDHGDASSAAVLAARAAETAARQFLPWANGSWVEGRQAELRQVHLEALELRARAAICQSQWSTAITAAEEAIVLEPYREAAYVSLLAAHAGAGRRGEALRAYERCRHLLAEELGVSPSGLTEAAYVALLGDEPTSQPTSPPAAFPLPLPTALARVPGTFIVGREAEAEVLAAALKRVDAEGRQSVLVTGEPGVGKTALVAELARNAHSERARVLYGRCDEDLGVAYQPFAQALGHWAEHCALAELESHIGRCGSVLARLVPSLSRRLPGVVAPPLTDAETDRSVLFEAVSDALVTASASAPVLMVLEDLHWASSPTLLLLRHLVSGVHAARMLVVGTWRHSDVDASHPLAATLADLRRHPGVGRVRLEGLDQAGVAAFVEAAGAGGDDPVGLAVDLHAHTAGNPFFVGEVLRHLGETVPAAPKRWLDDARAGVVQAPEGVVEVVGRRVSRLSPLSNRTLVLASVAGTEFDLAVVEAAADPADADRSLDGIEEAVRARLVEESASAGRYSFAHALVRQSLYGSLGRTRRARLHRRVGEALESLSDDDRLRLPALAHHFSEAAFAGCGAKAADYAMAAVKSAIDHGGADVAGVIIERALEALDAVQPPDLARRCDLFIELANVRTYTQASIQAIRDAGLGAVEAARALGSAERLAKAATRLQVLIWPSDYERAASLLSEALALADEGSPALRADLMSALAVIGVLPDDESKRLCDEALALARSADSLETLGLVLFKAFLVLVGSSHAAELLAVTDELVERAPAGAWHGWRHGYRVRAVARLVLGDRAGFDADLDGAEQHANLRSDSNMGAAVALWRANQALLDGRFVEAERHIEEHRDHWPDPERAGYILQLAALRQEQGRLAGMVVPLTEVLAGAAASGEDRRLGATALSHAFLTFAHLSEGTRASADAHYREAARIDVRQWQRPLMLSYVAELSIALCDTTSAPGLYERLLPNRNQILASGIAPCCPGSVDRYLGILASAMRRWDEAEEHFRLALDMECGLRAPPLVARTKHWYARMLLERGARGDGERARELLVLAFQAAQKLGQVALASESSRYLEPSSSLP